MGGGGGGGVRGHTGREASGAARISAIFAARSAAASETQAVVINLSRRTWRNCLRLLLRRPLAMLPEQVV